MASRAGRFGYLTRKMAISDARATAQFRAYTPSPRGKSRSQANGSRADLDLDAAAAAALLLLRMRRRAPHAVFITRATGGPRQWQRRSLTCSPEKPTGAHRVVGKGRLPVSEAFTGNGRCF